MEFRGGRSHRMAAWTHIRERENEGRTEDGEVVFVPEWIFFKPSGKTKRFRRPPTHYSSSTASSS